MTLRSYSKDDDNRELRSIVMSLGTIVQQLTGHAWDVSAGTAVDDAAVASFVVTRIEAEAARQPDDITVRVSKRPSDTYETLECR